MNTRDITSQCQVVHFAWDFEGDSTGDLENINLAQLAKATPHDISNYITSVSFQKRIEDAAGEFEIVLANTQDWEEAIRKGSWALIYMSQDGGLSIPTNPTKRNLPSGGRGDSIDTSKLRSQRPKLRALVYIDTVRSRGTIGEKGEIGVEYVLSGRDFGAIYEETEIWHNQILFDNNLLLSAASFLNNQTIKTVDGLLTILHKLFYSPSDIINKPLKNDSLVSIALQWLMPTSLFGALGITLAGGKKSYYGNIPDLLNFDASAASFPIENPLALLNGIAWDRLKSHSLDPYHELFTELSDEGLPQLTFRMLPWKLFSTNSKFPVINKTIKKFGTTGLVNLPTIDLLDWDIGEDNHTRFNAYLTTVVTGQVSIQTSLQMIGDNDPKTGFPRLLQNGIRRHGLRLLYREMNALVDLGAEKADSSLLKEFNEFSVELWARSHDYKSGTMSIIGNNGIRVGKCIKLASDAPANAKKIFYIEGYEDTFSVDEKGVGEWKQTLFITRGIEDAVLRKATNINQRVNPTNNDGEFTGSK